ncbi:MAG: zinc-dependent alcohol dehydrogenase family protein [Actinobacteria bacterium]|nr:zinc-dependent alcohol dehydrogenase family protein [Actinomycetota bacterium]
MKAAMFYKPGSLEIVEMDIPKFNEDEILIKVKACGICGTDKLIFSGDYFAKFPIVLGHEYSGIIDKVGKNVTGFLPGDKVAVDPNILCGKCSYCLRGLGHLCKNYSALGVIRNGGFAEYSVVPVSNIYKIESFIELTDAAIIEPLACCMHGVDMANVKSGDVVVILGAGLIGNLILQLVRISGASRTIIVEPLENRKKLALESGADYVLDPVRDNLVNEIKKIESEGADVIFECSGSREAQEISLNLSRRGGTIIYFGCSPEDQVNNISPFIIGENELTIRGVYNNPYTTYRAAKLISSNKIKTKHLISHKLPLSEIRRGFEIFGTNGVNKIIIINNS